MKLGGEGVKNVTTASTAVVLGSVTGEKIAAVVLTAKSTNTGVIYYGSSTVEQSTLSGTPLVAGQSATVPLGGGDLDDIYIDSTVNGEGVSYTYYIE